MFTDPDPHNTFKRVFSFKNRYNSIYIKLTNLCTFSNTITIPRKSSFLLLTVTTNVSFNVEIFSKI